MAASAARSFLRSSAPSSLRGAAARAASRAGPAPLPRRMPTSAPRALLLRSPVEMSSVCLETLMPMHSATASALMTSLLAAPACKGFGWLSEDAYNIEAVIAIYCLSGVTFVPTNAVFQQQVKMKLDELQGPKR
ncbi:hypothetical protein U9M48_017695 [Paspalum notatum var. saurae]